MESLESQVAELVRRPSTMLKTLYFNGSQQNLQITLEIISFYDQGRKRVQLLAGEA